MKWKTCLPANLASLADHLTLEKVLLSRDETRLFISFLSDELVEEKPYLALKATFQRVFSGMSVSLRVATPALWPRVEEDLSAYVLFLTDCLSRATPGARPWLQDAEWTLTDDLLEIALASEPAVSYVEQAGLAKRLVDLVEDVFRQKVRVRFVCLTDREKQIARLTAITSQAEEAIRVEMEQQKVAVAKAAILSPKIFGPAIQAPIEPIEILTNQTGKVAVEGEITSTENHEFSGKTLLTTFFVKDRTGVVACKLFQSYKAPRGVSDAGAPENRSEQAHTIAAMLSVGQYVRVQGDCFFDKYLKDLSITVASVCRYEPEVRRDNAPVKRVELHMHTRMSHMDAIPSAEDLIAQAAAWGHPAIAVTDHGVLHAFPEAFAAAKKHGILFIPGVETYLTDEAKIVDNPSERALSEPIVIFDLETTGLHPQRDRIVEIGAVMLQNGEIIKEYTQLIQPECKVSAKTIELTGITDEQLLGQPTFAEVADDFLAFVGDAPLAAHNTSFDVPFLTHALSRVGKSWQGTVVDTLTGSRRAFPLQKSHKLELICRHLGIRMQKAHRALHDARATAQLLLKIYDLSEARGADTLAKLNGAFSGDLQGGAHHATLLCINQTGITNLNHIVSESHLKHFYRHPLTPRNLLQKWREGLLVGSACSSGELFKAILAKQDDRELSRIARFYDFLEIMPTDNNAYLLREGVIENHEALQDINRRIVELGAKLGIPVVATGDVHALTPEDCQARVILQSAMGYKDAAEQPTLHFRTTEEMLSEFAYLGEETALRVVVDNPRRIAERVGPMTLFPPHPEGKETFQPELPGAAEAVEQGVWQEARARYGDPLPPVIQARLEKELSSIIGYGYATLYRLAQLLVNKSEKDGYLVGSRGSVGSSLAATMLGITEVNPLTPHYRCPQCCFVEFSEAATVGMDLPEKACPTCGTTLLREGFDIPFEVFLGFKGDKVPDIDLNFSGRYQSRAHQYVVSLFGEENVFRAGTITCIQEKTALAFVEKYLASQELVATEAEKKRMAQSIVGARRSTGQHPGGIVILPKGYEIQQFTALQRPANAEKSQTITTHIDFDSMHDVLVKLDILGHDGPTMLSELAERTGMDVLKLPLTDPHVVSLFTNPNAMGITAEDIRCQTGTLGIPEFGTRFVRGMLAVCKPQTMEELIRISGLSHGTDVWAGNAETLIKQGTATLSECICTRDDIINALMARGVPAGMAFQTMESVRKGRGLTPAMEVAMRDVDTPNWFIESCKKIKYMFPKGHAVAYVTTALRIAWFKLYQPLSYYATYYTVKPDKFDIFLMDRPVDALRQAMDDLALRFKTLTNAEKDQQIPLEIALEMASRGIRFLPIDLYKSQVDTFLVEGDAIRPPFTAIPGLGASAADSIVDARKKGAFQSVEDFKARTRVSTSLLDSLRQRGALSSIPETNQVSFF